MLIVKNNVNDYCQHYFCPQVETFIMMYRTHCQRMLDTVVSANFEGVS